MNDTNSFRPQNPLIVQGDHSLLLEVHNSLYEQARAAIGTFAELEKSPEHIHTYRITPLSLWNATAAGLSGERMTAALVEFAKYPVPQNVLAEIRDQAGRWGRVKLRSTWAKQQHDGWREVEQSWIERALTGPLFHLGLVALARAAGEKKSGSTLFSLMQLRRAVLFNPWRPTGEAMQTTALPPPVHDGACWVVQPNFDVIVYLDRASAARLAFIERIAARKPSTGATALYHLTRETVYAALESGIGADTLLETLARGCEYPLPGNIRQMLADWAGRREQLSVYRAVGVLEFADQAQRDTALAKQQSLGAAVGDRYILLSAQQETVKFAAYASRTVDYFSPPVRCLRVSEDGVVEVAPQKADLLVQSEISAWAETDSPDGNRWRITRQRVQTAVRAGWTADRILTSLRQRLQHDLPPLLFVAMRASGPPDVSRQTRDSRRVLR